MNIEHLFPATDLHVYKVSDVISEPQLKLLVKRAEGKIPTGYRQDEIDNIINLIRAAGIEACKTIFEDAELEAADQNMEWPWFDISVGEARGVDSSKVFTKESGTRAYLSEFVVQPAASGGEISFQHAPETLIKLAPGEMLVASRAVGHEFEILEIAEGTRFTLMTHIFAK